MTTREKTYPPEVLYPKAYFDRAWESFRQKRRDLHIKPQRHRQFVDFINHTHGIIERPRRGWLFVFEPKLNPDEQSYFATLSAIRRELDEGVKRRELAPKQKGKLMNKFAFTEPKEIDF